MPPAGFQSCWDPRDVGVKGGLPPGPELALVKAAGQKEGLLLAL